MTGYTLSPAGTGSSPRARGTRPAPPARVGRRRFIPASAGNTCSTRAGRSSRSVHPRERGEHARGRGRARRDSGSSPRARGNTHAERVRGIHHPVHPRERGEHHYPGSPANSRAGSSPRARGTPVPRRHASGPRRFIPASAGNTPPAASGRTARPVHPRERGEHGADRVQGILSSGSSPRARGTPRQHQQQPGRERFIPASAGNTGSCASSMTPRYGSSPRARGTRRRRRCRRPGRRFIPASAGNTPAAAEHVDLRPVHPRERGEHGQPFPFAIASIGSSPRARGTRLAGHLLADPARFIPASAGNTTASAACLA